MNANVDVDVNANGLPVALVSYEDLDRSAYSRARIARALVGTGVDPIFLGPPRRPSCGELLNIASKGGSWSLPIERGREDGVATLTPLDLPGQRLGPLARWDARSTAHALEALGPEGWVVVFPTGSGKPPPRPKGWKLCWYLTDEFAADNESFAAREAPLLAECDLLVGVSETIVAPRRARVPRAAVLPNGYEGVRFPAGGARPHPDAEIAALPPPRIGYFGAVSRTKVDVGLLVRLAVARPHYTFVLAGDRPDPGHVGPLRGLANVRMVDGRPYALAPGIVSALDVCLLPYRDTPVNRACSPLKAREALALGLPVVSTQVDELAAHPGAAYVGRDDEELLLYLDRAVAGELPRDPNAVRWFTDATWEVRARAFADLLLEGRG